MRSKKQIETNILEGKTWYKVPEYKVMLVRDNKKTETETKFIKSPDDVNKIIQSYLNGVDREHFAIVLLNRKNGIIGINTVSVGDLSSSIVHPREVFKPAIVAGAASIILAHNHPSGDPTPSLNDVRITKRIKEAGDILGIEVLDHIIIGDGCYESLKARDLF
ncbi:MAG TPA: DNA repair protein RadC [Tissierellia bacterium]|nr:DNA repair protein RadC [Tissierellia bacterium]